MTRAFQVDDGRGRLPDGELARLRRLWLHVTALAVADQDEAWMRGTVPYRNLVLEAAGIEPGYWDHLMLPVADAIAAERALAEREHRAPKAVLLGSTDRTRLRRSGMVAR